MLMLVPLLMLMLMLVLMLCSLCLEFTLFNEKEMHFRSMPLLPILSRVS